MLVCNNNRVLKLHSFVAYTNMAAVPLSFESLEIECKPRIYHFNNGVIAFGDFYSLRLENLVD